MGVVNQQLDRMGIRFIQPGLTRGGDQPAVDAVLLSGMSEITVCPDEDGGSGRAEQVNNSSHQNRKQPRWLPQQGRIDV